MSFSNIQVRNRSWYRHENRCSPLKHLCASDYVLASLHEGLSKDVRNNHFSRIYICPCGIAIGTDRNLCSKRAVDDISSSGGRSSKAAKVDRRGDRQSMTSSSWNVLSIPPVTG